MRFASVLVCGTWAAILLVLPRPMAAQQAAWETKSPMPTAREKLATCAIGQYIYAIGGAIGDNGAGLGVNERYDTVNDTWSARARMPTGRRDVAAAVVDGKCYAIGGHENFGTQSLTAVEVYDPETDSWAARADLPSGRLAAAAATVGGRIYLAGGFTSRSTPVDSLLVYDPDTDSWMERASMSVARAGLAATAWDGKFYALGGSNSPAVDRKNIVEVYDPGANRWTTLANMPTALAILAAEAVNGDIYAIGGAPLGSPVSDVSIYSTTSDSWTAGPPLSFGRNRHASSVVNGTIYVIGGSRTLATPHPGIADVEALRVGSPGFEINAGIGDAWYDPATDGQGFFIIVFPDIELIFLAWFTYETERPPQDIMAILGEPGHRWLTAQGPYSGDSGMLDIIVTRGGVFDMPNPVPASDTEGALIVQFDSCTEGTISYDLPGLELSGEIPIQRITGDRVALCETLSAGD